MTTPQGNEASAAGTPTAENERHGQPARGRRFRMAQRLEGVTDDYVILDDQGVRVFKVDGTALRDRDMVMFREMNGDALCRIQLRVIRFKDTMEIEDAHGRPVAYVRKETLGPHGDRYLASMSDGLDLEITGNLLEYEYAISNGRNTVGEISKRWFHARDSYGVEVAPGHHEILILAATVCIDQIARAAD